VLLGVLVLIFGMITVLLEQLLDPEECENLESQIWRLAYRLQQHN